MHPGLRRQPSQDRSTQRIELILDTTARLIDQVGYSSISPALIARNAAMSGPAVYRYFSDLDAIISALAARVMERFLLRIGDMLADSDLVWQDAMAGAVDIYADMFANEPGFRIVRLQGSAAKVPIDSQRDTSAIADAVIGYFKPRFEAWDRPLFREHVQVMIEIIEALVTRAFESTQFDFFIAEAKRVSTDYLATYLAEVPGTPPATQGQ
jgi:AcrR family transcriptional regulator